MAFKEVKLTEEEAKGGNGRKFKKFEAIGDKYTGVLLGTETETKTFNAAEGPKTVTTYIFWGGKDGEAEITPPHNLKQALLKAMKPVSDGGMGLTPYSGDGKPWLVRMTFTSTQDTGQASPMKLFTVSVDDAPNLPADAIRAIPVLRAAPAKPSSSASQGGQRRAPPPDDAFGGHPPSDDDDIPF